MENNGRYLRKRKSAEKDLNKEVKKQYNDHQKRDRRQRQTTINKDVKQIKSAADKKAKSTTNDVLKIPKKDVPNEDEQTERGLGREVKGKNIHVERDNSTTMRQNLKYSTVRTEEKESKHKEEDVFLGYSSKGKVGLLENESRYKKGKNAIANSGKDLECFESENIKFQNDIKALQAERDKLNEELRSSRDEADEWKRTAMAAKAGNKRIQQEKIALEKKIIKSSCDVKIKARNESRFKCVIEFHKTQIKERERIISKLNDDVTSLQKDNDELHKRLENSQLENGNKLNELSKKLMKRENEAQEKEIELKKESTEANERLNTERAKRCQLEKNISLLSQKNTTLEAEMRNLKKIIDNREKLSNENEVMKYELIQKEQISKSESTTPITEIAELERDNNILQNKLKDIKQKMKDSEATLTVKMNTAEAKVLDISRELERFKESNLDKDKTHKSLQQEHMELQRMYDTIKQKFDQFKRIRTIEVQLFHCSGTPLVSKVENEITALLKKEMENEVTKLEFIECGSNTDIVPETPLLIVCINASRLGTDAQNVIKSLKVTSKMALLVFHHKDDHALPHQASEHVLTGHEFKRLGGIFDFGFLSSKGIYPCKLNDQNLKYVVNFINKEGTRCVKDA